MKPGTNLYPVQLDLSGKSCLVVGAGRIAARKIVGLLAAGAVVTAVAPEIGPEVETLAADPRVDVQVRPYSPGEVRQHCLVITATGVQEVDHAVSSDAQASGIWVNSADDPSNCSFILPAIHRDGPVSIAVSSSAVAPAMVSWLRDRIAIELGDGLAALAQLLSEARDDVKRQGRSTEAIDWRRVLDGDLPALVREGNLEEARRLLDELVAGP